MNRNLTLYRSSKPVFVRGSGLIPYRRVMMRGRGMQEIFKGVTKSMGKIFTNPKLQASAKRIVYDTGKRIFTQKLEDKVVSTASNAINNRINKIIDGVDQGAKTELSPQEFMRAKKRVTATLETKGEKKVESAMEQYLRERRGSLYMRGSGMRRGPGRPKKSLRGRR